MPVENNQAERDIRMTKLQPKISGSWRTETRADAFLTVRSCLFTAPASNNTPRSKLRDFFTGDDWIPEAGHWPEQSPAEIESLSVRPKAPSRLLAVLHGGSAATQVVARR